MSLEEEHEALHRGGEMIKFLFLVVILVGTVLLVAFLRPLIFEHIVPSVLGWNGERPEPEVVLPGPETPEGQATEAATEIPAVVTATSSAGDETADRAANEDMGAPLPTPQMYVVQAGDSLARIGERFSVSVEALVQANGITNPNRIQVGDVLVIPEPQP